MTEERPQRLSYGDTRRILERLGTVDSLVLVGGQALNFWCELYQSALPDLAQHGPFASKDIDFQGHRAAAQRCAELLDAKCKLPRIDDATPSSGLVEYTDEHGISRRIDFLSQVFGLNASEVLRRSVPIEIPRPDGAPVTIKVMHPLHCMESRVHNVVGLPGQYDNEHGVKQVKASILCVREAITRTLGAVGARGALRFVERVFEFALSPHAKTLYRTHQIDVFAAVPHALPELPQAFREKRYPQMLTELSRSRGDRA